MTSAGDGHELPHDRPGFHASSAAAAPQHGPGAGRPGAPATAGATAAGEIEPDPRFTLANERTFLAWSRTALALVAAGLGIVQLLPPFPGVPLGRHVLGIPLIVLGAVVAITAYFDMNRNQLALRRGGPLPRSVLPRLLTVTIGGVATAAAVVVILSAIR
jgi:putative membrane protein